MLFKELKEKDQANLKYSDGHMDGGVRAIQMVLHELKEDGLLNAYEKENWSARLLNEWEKINAYGLGTVDEHPKEEDDQFSLFLCFKVIVLIRIKLIGWNHVVIPINTINQKHIFYSSVLEWFQNHVVILNNIINDWNT